MSPFQVKNRHRHDATQAVWVIYFFYLLFHFVFNIRVLSHNRLLLDGILHLCETQEEVCGFEKCQRG